MKNKEKEKAVPVSVRLTQKQLDELERLAKYDNRKVVDIIREAIELSFPALQARAEASKKFFEDFTAKKKKDGLTGKLPKKAKGLKNDLLLPRHNPLERKVL